AAEVQAVSLSSTIVAYTRCGGRGRHRPGVCSLLIAPALAALIFSAPTCGPLDLPMAQALAVARSDEVGIKRSEAATAEADKAIAFAIRWLPEFNALLTSGVVPGARLQDPTNGNDITAIKTGSKQR